MRSNEIKYNRNELLHVLLNHCCIFSDRQVFVRVKSLSNSIKID